ncbi:hypothetical protein ACFX13_005867 [Malus domestica]
MSVEEDRLWNIVRANSKDFNAWTTLIEEAETVAKLISGCITAFLPISTYGNLDTVRRRIWGAGWLEEAEELIMSMPEKSNSVIWGALLGACRTHGDLRGGNLAFKHFTELEPMSSYRYKLAGIMFANAGERKCN